MSLISSPHLDTVPAFKAFQTYHAAVRATRYRITVARFDLHRPPTVFTLDKPPHGLAPGWTPDHFGRNFSRLLQWQARGFNIYYTPLHPRMAYLLLDDLSYVAYTHLIDQQYRPAVVIESSPGNYQALFLAATRSVSRSTLNTWVRQMNHAYGDPHLSGAEHAHRAPGFLNSKPAYRRADGSYPTVILHKATYRFCFHTATDLRQLQAQHPFPSARTPASSALPSPLPPITDINALTARWPELPSLYRYHAHDICTRYPDPDYSRVDSMIALRLRGQGYSLDAIAASVLVMAPQIRPAVLADTHRWPDYARRTALWAFRAEATHQLTRLSDSAQMP